MQEDGETMKKKKLTFNALALGNLKHRKKRYTLMILGIVLSMVFSSSIIYFVFSAYSTSQEQTKADCGIFDMYCNDYEEDLFEKANEQDAFEKFGAGSVIGFAFTDEEDKLNGTSVVRLDEVSKKLMNPIFISGSYPENKGEIAIEQTTLLQLGLSAKVGDEITLKFQVQNDDELLLEIKEKTYKLTGILRDKRSNISMGLDEKKVLPSAFVSEYERVDLGGKENPVAYCTLTKTGYFTMYELIGETSTTLFSDCLFTYYEAFSLDSDESESLIYILIIVAVLLVASSMGIVNAFTTNLKERKKQIGLYRAVGATKKQIFALFLRESVMLSLICTPISLVISFVAVKVIVNNIFEEAFFRPNLWVLLACGAFSLICVILASLIPLFSSSRITPMQAIRNIETTRKLKNKKIKPQKEFNVSKLLAKRNLVISKGKQAVVSIFLVLTIMFSAYALSYLTYALDDIYTLNYDYGLMLQRDLGYYAVNYPEGNNGFSENHLQTILLNENIKSVYGYKNANINILIDGSEPLSDYRFIKRADYNFSSDSKKEEIIQKLTESNYRNLLESTSLTGRPEDLDIIKAAGYKGDFIATDIIALDEKFIEEISDCVYEGSIDINKLNSGEQVIVCAPKKVYLTVQTDEYDSDLFTYSNKENMQSAIDRGENIELIATEKCDYKAGEKMDLSVLYSEEHNPNFDLEGEMVITKENVEVNNKQVEIGAVVCDIEDKVKVNIFLNSGIITTTQGMEHFFPKAKYKQIFCELKDDCTEEIDKEVTEVIKSVADCVDEAGYQSNYEYQMEQKETIKNLILLVLSMVILFYTICGSIINNTISANIKEDKKKIGTLRAVGANEKDISKSYILQLLSMFKWGFGIGFGGFALSYLIIVLTNKYTGLADALVFNPWITLLLGLILFAICSLSVYTKIRKETRNSIVENIREL